METSWFDIVMASLILVIGVKGVFNGLIRELSGLVGIVAGVWLASLFAENFGEWLNTYLIHIDSESAIKMIGFLALLTMTWLGFIVLGVIVSKVLTLSEMGVVNRTLGFLAASAKIFIILAVIVFALSTIDFVKKNSEPYIKKSLLYPYFIKTGQAIIHIEPKGVLKHGDVLKNDAKIFIKKSERTSKELEKKKISKGSP